MKNKMATIEKLRKKLTKVEGEKEKAEDALARFERGERGQKLTVLEDKQCEEDLTEMEEQLLEQLEGVKKKLEEEVSKWNEEVRSWGKKLREFTQPGNDFVIRALGT